MVAVKSEGTRNQGLKGFGCWKTLLRERELEPHFGVSSQVGVALGRL